MLVAEYVITHLFDRILEAVVLISYFAGTYQRMKQGGELWFWILFLVLALIGGFFACVTSYGDALDVPAPQTQIRKPRYWLHNLPLLLTL